MEHGLEMGVVHMDESTEDNEEQKKIKKNKLGRQEDKGEENPS